ncbi:hypothetical protein [Microbulbifer guangxiensis]|uniref:hypothetical protein n=1 Tax=Microbulbifer guangxiensis TaxID=2904249 RepID=UPI001F29DE91|nr:hypothetical protein [Microbulbifer guangxiensis]
MKSKPEQSRTHNPSRKPQLKNLSRNRKKERKRPSIDHHQNPQPPGTTPGSMSLAAQKMNVLKKHKLT